MRLVSFSVTTSVTPFGESSICAGPGAGALNGCADPASGLSLPSGLMSNPAMPAGAPAWTTYALRPSEVTLMGRSPPDGTMSRRVSPPRSRTRKSESSSLPAFTASSQRCATITAPWLPSPSPEPRPPVG